MAHWGVPDPAAVEGDETTRIEAFRTAFHMLENRIEILVNLPIASLDRLKLQQQLDAIGDNRPQSYVGSDPIICGVRSHFFLSLDNATRHAEGPGPGFRDRIDPILRYSVAAA